MDITNCSNFFIWGRYGSMIFSSILPASVAWCLWTLQALLKTEYITWSGDHEPCTRMLIYRPCPPSCLSFWLGFCHYQNRIFLDCLGHTREITRAPHYLNISDIKWFVSNAWSYLILVFANKLPLCFLI